MEYKIILGLSIISASLCFASGMERIDRCVPLIDADNILSQCHTHWKALGKHVSNDTSRESRNGEMHCYTRCLYEKMGIFYDHKFHTWAIREIMTNYVSHPLSHKLAELIIWNADIANMVGGDDCEMADDFWELNNENNPDMKELMHAIFCESDPWLNPE